MANLITIEQKILKKNAEIALENRREIDARGAFGVGLLSAPGSGKTSLLEKLLQELRGRARCAVVEGDVQTDRDARRIAALDVPVVQIVTNGTCHLEARMVQEALPQVPAGGLDLLFIENVGNLVCPASYELGEHIRVVVMSTTEGEDKPVKYPALFRNADALVLNKIDLLPHLPGFFVMTFFTAAAAAGFGLVLATLCKSRQQLSGLATILILTMSALGGSMFPRFLMPESIRRIGNFTFNAHALDGYQAVFWRDARLIELWPQVAILTGLTVAFMTIARLLARRWETL